MRTINMTLCLVLAIVGTVLTSCSDDDTGGIAPIKVEYDRVTQTDFAAQSNDFANNLLATLAAKPETANGNIVVSPISMQYLLSMVANTASEEAQAELFQAMGMTGYTLSQVNQYSKELLGRLQQDDRYVKVALANSIWAADGISFSPNFEATIKDYYNGCLTYHDFASKSSEVQGLINKWAQEHTQGMVPAVSANPSAQTALILANATYFNGKWSMPFNGRDTCPGTFYNEDNTTSQVNMMNKDMAALVYADQEITAAELTYGRGYYSMIIVMPKDIKELIANKTDWWGVHNKLVKASEVKIVLPKFKVQNSWSDMKDVCQQMGISKIFTFDPNTSVIGTQMAQDVVIEVDENGTKAASASHFNGEYGLIDIPKEVCFDHPFVYAVRENTTGTILFIGKVGRL